MIQNLTTENSVRLSKPERGPKTTTGREQQTNKQAGSRLTSVTCHLTPDDVILVVRTWSAVSCNFASLLYQVDTDESLLLESRHVFPYSWRVSRALQSRSRLHVCIETEGDWRWSEPFELDAVGSFSRTIRHRLHSATLFIEVKALTGMQKQVGFVGGTSTPLRRGEKEYSSFLPFSFSLRTSPSAIVFRSPQFPACTAICPSMFNRLFSMKILFVLIGFCRLQSAEVT